MTREREKCRKKCIENILLPKYNVEAEKQIRALPHIYEQAQVNHGSQKENKYA
jgi:hypothetical protein